MASGPELAVTWHGPATTDRQGIGRWALHRADRRHRGRTSHHNPSSRHHRLPAPSQMVMLTTLMRAPSRHQVTMSTLPDPKRMGAAAVP